VLRFQGRGQLGALHTGWTEAWTGTMESEPAVVPISSGFRITVETFFEEFRVELLCFAVTTRFDSPG
jgi:hypothetical protein